jgi:osmotically-inducible protein OsmY
LHQFKRRREGQARSETKEEISIMGAHQQYATSFDLENRPVSIPRSRAEPARLAESQLRGSAYPELRSLRCNFHEGVLTLRGKVSRFYATQLAQALAARVPGVEEVDNRIEVKEDSEVNRDRRLY